MTTPTPAELRQLASNVEDGLGKLDPFAVPKNRADAFDYWCRQGLKTISSMSSLPGAGAAHISALSKEVYALLYFSDYAESYFDAMNDDEWRTLEHGLRAAINMKEGSAPAFLAHLKTEYATWKDQHD